MMGNNNQIAYRILIFSILYGSLFSIKIYAQTQIYKNSLVGASSSKIADEYIEMNLEYYKVISGPTINWSITGGTIISGVTSSAVEVKWDETVSSHSLTIYEPSNPSNQITIYPKKDVTFSISSAASICSDKSLSVSAQLIINSTAPVYKFLQTSIKWVLKDGSGNTVGDIGQRDFSNNYNISSSISFIPENLGASNGTYYIVAECWRQWDDKPFYKSDPIPIEINKAAPRFTTMNTISKKVVGKNGEIPKYSYKYQILSFIYEGQQYYIWNSFPNVEFDFTGVMYGAATYPIWENEVVNSWSVLDKTSEDPAYDFTSHSFVQLGFAELSGEGCSANVYFTPPQISILNENITKPRCSSLNEGSFKITGTNNENYTLYKINSISTNSVDKEIVSEFQRVIDETNNTVTYSELYSGEYIVSISKSPFFIEKYIDLRAEPMQITNLTPVEPSCFEGYDGSIKITEIEYNGTKYNNTQTFSGSIIFDIEGNTSSFSNISFPFTITGNEDRPITAGNCNLSFIVTNNGCVSDISYIYIDEQTPITIKSMSVTQPKTCLSSDASINLTASASTDNFEYQLFTADGVYYPANNSGAFSEIPGGNYYMEITDEKECKDTFEIEVPLPTNNLSATTDLVNHSKCNKANGSATVSVSGGTPPFSYQWDNGETTATANSLIEAIHTVTVTDAKNCNYLVENIDIAGTLVPVILSQDVPALCSDSEGGGSLTVNITNVEEPYTISWDGMNFTTNTATDLAPGFYSGKIMDNLGCEYPFEGKVTAPNELRANLSNYQSPVCDNDNTGVLTVQGVGGTPNYTFTWIDFPDLGNVNTISNLYPGTYQLKITDDNNCVSTQTFDLFNTDNINFDIVDSVFLCQGQSATIDAGNPGSVYDWTSNNGFSATSQSVVLQNEGDYSVTVTNENGCTGQKEFHVKYDDRLFEVAFLISTESTIEDTLVLIEISWPVPDSVQWIIPNEFTRLVDGTSYKELIPSQLGDYTIGMKAFLGGCSGIVEKQITILAADSTLALKEFSQILIRKVNLFPNPNNGIFEIDIELATETDIQVDLYSMDGMKMQASKFEKGLQNYNIKYNLMSLEPGFYFINIIAGKEMKKVKFIVN